MSSIVVRRAIGLFPETPALDESWRLSHEDPPPVGGLVDVCWTRRETHESEVEYHVSTGSIKKIAPPDAFHGHTWCNERGEVVIFNPDFWRPRAES